MLGSSPKKSFLKSIVSPRKRSPATDELVQTSSVTPQLPLLNFRTHVDQSQHGAGVQEPREAATPAAAAPQKTPTVKHKKSNSNISVRSLFGDKSSKHKQGSKNTADND